MRWISSLLGSTSRRPSFSVISISLAAHFTRICVRWYVNKAIDFTLGPSTETECVGQENHDKLRSRYFRVQRQVSVPPVFAGRGEMFLTCCAVTTLVNSISARLSRQLLSRLASHTSSVRRRRRSPRYPALSPVPLTRIPTSVNVANTPRR